MGFMHLSAVALLFICFLDLPHASAHPAVDSYDASSRMIIGKKTSVFVDDSRRLNIQDVLSDSVQRLFVKSTAEAPTFNGMRGAVWLKFTIEDVGKSHRILEFFYPLLDSVEVFGLRKTSNGTDAVIYRKLIGSMIPFSERDIKYSTLLFDLPSDADVYYVRIVSTYSMQIIPVVMTDAAFHLYSPTRSLLHGLYFGFVMMIIAYSFFLWVGTKDALYLYYILHVLANGLLLAHMNGFTNRFLWGEFPQVNLFEPSIFGLAIFSTVFSIQFLKTRDAAPKIHRWLLAAVWLNLLVFPLNLAGLNFWANQLVQVVALFGCGTMLAAGIALYKQGYQPARFFVVSWCVFLVGVCLTVLDRVGAIPHSVWTYHASQVGSALDIMLLSLALADRINVLRAEKDAAQAEALKAIEEREALTRHQNELLEEKVRLRTEQILMQNKLLEQRKTQLEELIKTKDRLFSVIGHDLRNPISGIWQLSEFLEASPKFPADEKSTLTTITKTSKQTLELVEDILSWSRNLPFSGDEQRQLVDLAQLAQLAMTLLSSSAQRKTITLNATALEPALIEADENMISAVIRNLISNAIKFTPAGGMVSVQTKVEGNVAMFEVKDTGVGMSEETVQKIISAKSLASTLGTAGEKGTGMGLLFCKDFIEHFGGNFLVDSTLGKGSTFRVAFPAATLRATATNANPDLA